MSCFQKKTQKTKKPPKTPKKKQMNKTKSNPKQVIKLKHSKLSK